MSFSVNGPPGMADCFAGVATIVGNENADVFLLLFGCKAACRYRSNDNSIGTAPVGSTSSANTWLSVYLNLKLS